MCFIKYLFPVPQCSYVSCPTHFPDPRSPSPGAGREEEGAGSSEEEGPAESQEGAIKGLSFCNENDVI